MKTTNDKIKWAMNVLRRASYKLGESYAAKVRARVQRGKYECADCGNLFGPKEIDMDHIKPVVDPKEGFTDLNSWVDRLLPGVDGYQVLCKPCHKQKTKEEAALRAKYRRLRKDVNEK